MITIKKSISASVNFDVYDAIQEFRWFNSFDTQSSAVEMILRAGMYVLKDEYPELDLGVALYTGRNIKDMA